MSASPLGFVSFHSLPYSLSFSFPNIPAMWLEPLFPPLGILFSLSSCGCLSGLQLSNDSLKITFQTTQTKASLHIPLPCVNFLIAFIDLEFSNLPVFTLLIDRLTSLKCKHWGGGWGEEWGGIAFLSVVFTSISPVRNHNWICTQMVT